MLKLRILLAHAMHALPGFQQRFDIGETVKSYRVGVDLTRDSCVKK